MSNVAAFVEGLARRGRAGFGGGGEGLHLNTVPTFTVSGAGKSECNGHYRQEGTHAGKPMYKQVGGRGLIYFAGFWKLNNTSTIGGW
jgi:hypothetical protein